MMAKYLLPALIFATKALAQDCSGTLTISASADVSALASCTTYSGSVVIPTGLAVPSDENGHQQLELTKVQEITGNLSVTNIDTLTVLHLDSIQSVGGIELGRLIGLADLSIGQLHSVEQLNWSALPALQSWSGSALTEAESILITNTGLASLDGLVNLQKVDYLNINNNPSLTNISLKLTSIGKSLDIEANDGYISGLSTSFPLLQTSQNMTFRNCSEILLPSLRNVSDGLGFYGNTFKSFNAPKLTTAGAIVFVDNADLTNVSLPALTTITQLFQIANNTQFKEVDGFPKLSVVQGAVDLSGTFTNVTLPSLTEVTGAFNLRTSEEFDCTEFQNDRDNKKLRGTYGCNGKTSTESGDGSSTSTSSGSSPSKTAGAATVDMSLPLVVGGFSFVSSLLQLLL